MANRVVPDRYGVINIGKLKENLVTEVHLPAPGFAGGSYAVLLRRPKEEQPYPVTVRHEGNSLVWTVQTADTAIAGIGKLECRWYGDNGEVAKSQTYTVRITDGLPDPTEAPEAWAGFMQQVSQDAGRAESAAGRAEALEKGYTEALEKARAAAEDAWQGKVSAETSAKEAKADAQRAETAASTATQAAQAAQTAQGAAGQAAQEAQKAAEASAGSAAQAAESVGGLADDLEATQKDLAKMKRAIQFQSELNKGQTWDFEVDTQEAYQRQVPSGAKAGAVMAVGGKTVVWNQLCDSLPNPGTYKGVKVAVSNGKVSLSGTATDAVLVGVGYAAVTVSGHKYMATGLQGGSKSTFYVQGVNENNGYYNILDSTAIFAATGAKYRYNIIAVAGTVFAHTFQPMVVDLTLLYGPGNEPTDTSDPRIAQIEAYAAAHPEYNAGELASALVDEVRVRGKNLINPESVERSSHLVLAYRKAGYLLKKGVQYILSTVYSIKPSGIYIVAMDNSTIVKSYSEDSITYTPDKDVLVYFKLYYSAPATLDDSKMMLEIGTKATAYSPYRDPVAYPIPSAVRNLPGYGWSAGSVANTVERTENGWQYVQRVGSVDLGTLDWYDGGTGTSARRMVTRRPPDNVKIPQESSALSNLVCPKYAPVTPDDTWLCRKEGIALNKGNAEVLVYDSAFAAAESLAAFKAHVTGVPLYYELATPITTDITAMMGDALAPFAVEAGGSITLHHPKADEGFAVDVPAKIQYITKLSEVSANG